MSGYLEPIFAWETQDLLAHLGAKYLYDPSRHDQGLWHETTVLLQQYVPTAPERYRGRLPSLWITPLADVRVHPLIRSFRPDSLDVPPPLYVLENGPRRTIVSVDLGYTGLADSGWWPVGEQTLVTLVRLAADLRQGRVLLDASTAIDLPTDQPPPLPLRNRLTTGLGIDPEGAIPVLRFGVFDGTSLELDDANSPLPASLPPGGEVRVPVPVATGGEAPWFVRVRGAYNQDGAGLAVQAGDQLLYSEQFVYLNAGGAGNFSAPALDGVPAEFHRCFYLPPKAAQAGELRLTNVGDQPVYFDALQVETRPGALRPRSVGLGAGFQTTRFARPSPIDPEVSRTWSSIRASIRAQHVGPPDNPRRWEFLHKLMQAQFAMNPRLELTLDETAAWFAVTPERYQLGKQAGRPHVVPPVPKEFAEIVEYVIKTWGDRIDLYEIWNEADGPQFFRGSYAEYAALFHATADVIERLDPTAKIQPSGMAGFKADWVEMLQREGISPPHASTDDRCEAFILHHQFTMTSQ